MNITNIIGIYSAPTVLFAVALILLFGNRELFSEFLNGAKEGAAVAFEIMPTLVILMTAVGMLTKSGGLSLLTYLLSPILSILGIPSEIIPTVILRPLSGSAANASVISLFSESNPDSLAGRCVSVLMGSSDTIIYTLSMYFGAVGIKKTRHALPASILTMLFCVIMSCALTKIFF